MNKMKELLIVILFFLVFVPKTIVQAEENLVNIYLFHSRDCSHCKAEIKFLDSLEEDYSNIKVHKYEIHDDENSRLLSKIAMMYKMRGNGVPFTVIGDKAFVGYNEDVTNVTFVKTVIYYSKYGYVDRVAKIVGNEELPVFKVDKKQISVNKFLKIYGNYKIIGGMETNDLDIEVISILTSLLLEFNLFNIFFVVGMLILARRLKIYKERIVSIFIYIVFYLLGNIIYLLNVKFLLVCGLFLCIIIILFFGSYYKKKCDICNIIYILEILLSIFSNCFKFIVGSKYKNIYCKTIVLNRLSYLDFFVQYCINSMISFFVLVILILFIRFIMNFIRKKIIIRGYS